MALQANYEGQYVVTCGDRFEAGVSLAKCKVTESIGGISVTSTVEPDTMRIDHAHEILNERMFYLTAETRGEPIIIWPMKAWANYASTDFVLPQRA